MGELKYYGSYFVALVNLISLIYLLFKDFRNSRAIVESHQEIEFLREQIVLMRNQSRSLESLSNSKLKEIEYLEKSDTLNFFNLKDVSCFVSRHKIEVLLVFTSKQSLGIAVVNYSKNLRNTELVTKSNRIELHSVLIPLDYSDINFWYDIQFHQSNVFGKLSFRVKDGTVVSCNIEKIN